jgi:hypothetical protein
MVHSRIDAGRFWLIIVQTLGKMRGKNGILLLLLADERIPRLQVLVDKWKYNIAMMNQVKYL